MPDYLNVPAIAEFMTSIGIQITKRQAYRLFEEPGFPTVRVRGKLFVRREALLEWLKSREPKAGRR